MKNNKRSLFGTIYTTGAPQVAELISLAGFDWIMIDMEHSALSLTDVQMALQAAGEEIIKIVRVPGTDEIWIKRILDTGCNGILVPMVNTAEDAASVVSYAKYPPEGQRSVGVGRSHAYGRRFGEYVSKANRDTIIMIQVEHADAVNNIDSILETSGISAIFIGPYDLSASMGFIGEPGHPQVKEAIRYVTEKCRKAGIPWGIFGANAEVLSDAVKAGCTWPLCSVDAMILNEAYDVLLKKLRG